MILKMIWAESKEIDKRQIIREKRTRVLKDTRVS